jgi:NADH:ubiquinone oxidoreductase subunit E
MRTVIERRRVPVPRYRREVAALSSLEQVYCRLSGAYAVLAALHEHAARIAKREERADLDFIRSQVILAASCHEAANTYLEGALIEHAASHPEEKPS